MKKYEKMSKSPVKRAVFLYLDRVHVSAYKCGKTKYCRIISSIMDLLLW